MNYIEHILLHRPPMIFLDQVLDVSHETLVATIRIREGIPFYSADSGVPAWVGLEYMAQSIAALAGIRARNADKPLPLGFIIGCRHFTTAISSFAPGSELRISVEELAAEEYGFGSFDCKIENPALIAEARVSVFGADRQTAA